MEDVDECDRAKGKQEHGGHGGDKGPRGGLCLEILEGLFAAYDPGCSGNVPASRFKQVRLKREKKETKGSNCGQITCRFPCILLSWFSLITCFEGVLDRTDCVVVILLWHVRAAATYSDRRISTTLNS